MLKHLPALLLIVLPILGGCTFDARLVEVEARHSCDIEYRTDPSALRVCKRCVLVGLKEAGRLIERGVPHDFIERWRLATGSIARRYYKHPLSNHDACLFGFEELEFQFLRQSPHLEPREVSHL